MDKDKKISPNPTLQPNPNRNLLIISGIIVGVILIIGVSLLIISNTRPKSEEKKTDTTTEVKKEDSKSDIQTPAEDETNVKLPTVTPPAIDTPTPTQPEEPAPTTDDGDWDKVVPQPADEANAEG
jgi:cytoskeletal protein RodZ